MRATIRSSVRSAAPASSTAASRTRPSIASSKVRREAAGLKESYSAHSLRAGHVTEALARGADRAAIKRQTGHASDAMLDRYARETNLAANNSSSGFGFMSISYAAAGILTSVGVAKLTAAGNAVWVTRGLNLSGTGLRFLGRTSAL
jgi:hypothetical protein